VGALGHAPQRCPHFSILCRRDRYRSPTFVRHGFRCQRAPAITGTEDQRITGPGPAGFLELNPRGCFRSASTIPGCTNFLPRIARFFDSRPRITDSGRSLTLIRRQLLEVRKPHRPHCLAARGRRSTVTSPEMLVPPDKTTADSTSRIVARPSACDLPRRTDVQLAVGRRGGHPTSAAPPTKEGGRTGQLVDADGARSHLETSSPRDSPVHSARSCPSPAPSVYVIEPDARIVSSGRCNLTEAPTRESTYFEGISKGCRPKIRLS